MSIVTHNYLCSLLFQSIKSEQMNVAECPGMDNTYRVGSLVSDSISRSSSLDKKKNLGKKRRFFSKYSFSPLRMSSRSSLDFFSLSSILSIVTTARTCLF